MYKFHDTRTRGLNDNHDDIDDSDDIVSDCVVVEQVENSASLYSKSVQGHHVCLLVKLLVCCACIPGEFQDFLLIYATADEADVYMFYRCFCFCFFVLFYFLSVRHKI